MHVGTGGLGANLAVLNSVTERASAGDIETAGQDRRSIAH